MGRIHANPYIMTINHLNSDGFSHTDIDAILYFRGSQIDVVNFDIHFVLLSQKFVFYSQIKVQILMKCI